MQGETLMSQVVTEFLDQHADMHDIGELCKTMTDNLSMGRLAKSKGYKFDHFFHEFHLHRFIPYVDENGEIDQLHIQHDFYF